MITGRLQDATPHDRTHHLVLETFVERGHGPHFEVARRFGVSPDEGEVLLRALAASGLPMWLYPGTDLVASCAPFNAQPTQDRATVDGRRAGRTGSSSAADAGRPRANVQPIGVGGGGRPSLRPRREMTPAIRRNT